MKAKMIIGAAAGLLSCSLLASSGLAQQDPAMNPTGQPAATISGQKDAQSVINSWPAKTKMAAQDLITKYGQPDGVLDNMLVWNDKGNWKRVTVFRDPVKHNDPMPHEDFIENTVAYHVPEGKVGELARFDHALVVDETRGELSSHCDSEKANTVALNIANEIVTGKRTVADAKSFMKRTMMTTMAGKSSSYSEKLQFKQSKASGSSERSSSPDTGIQPSGQEPQPMPQQSPMPTPQQGY